MGKEFEYVIAVAECKSISKAADILFISQPSLSRYISKLEDEVGLKLFVRSASGISLTEAGEVYVRYAKEIKGLQSTLERKLYQMKINAERKEICLCMTLNTSSLSTWKITEEFHEKFPDCQLKFVNTMAKDIPVMLDEQRCDIAIGPGVADPGRYDFKLLNEEYMILAVPVSFSLDELAEEREGMPFKWMDVKKLKSMNFLLQEKSCNVRNEVDRILQGIGAEVKPHMEFTNSILTIQAAERQLGCCFISEAFFPYIADRSSLRYYCIGDDETRTVSYAIYEKNRQLTAQEKFCISGIKRMLNERTEINRQEFRKLVYP